MKNYRPISILSNIGKIFDKVVCIRLTEYLEKNKILFNNQYGFRKFHNTTQALMSVNDYIKENNKIYEILGIFIDL